MRARRTSAWLVPWIAVWFAAPLGCGASTRTVGEDFEADGEAGAAGAAVAEPAGGTGGSSGAPGTEAGAGGDSTSGTAGSGGSTACTGGVVATSQIPRLTNEQYDRTLRDLLGVTTLTTFDGAVASSILTPYHTGPIKELDWQMYRVVGEAVAAQVMAEPALRNRFVACTPMGDGRECLHDTIVSFGRRAFRRPLTDTEIARFDAIVVMGAEITESGAPEDVAEVLLNTFLVSPSFILRTEISQTPGEDGTFMLSPHEIASRLSYMLWGTMPDPELDAAADAGELTTKEQILAQATRMLADPKAREIVRAFHRSYLAMGPSSRWGTVMKDPALFPEFTANVQRAMLEETERFFEAVVVDQAGTLPDLFSSPLAFVNADTAAIYDLDPATFGAELQAVNLDPALRPGFLTRIGFLSTHAHYDRPSPVLRGAVITRDILGIDTGPPSAAGLETPLPPGDSLTNRQRVEAQTSQPACAGCHELYLNPPGFALEAFDAIGAHQTADPASGAPIDTSAEVFIDGERRSVRGPADLMREIAASQDARRQYVKKWFSFAYARELHELDGCALDELTRNITGDGYRILDLLADLTQTDSFRLRAREEP